MVFKGYSLRFSTLGGRQYEDIGRYWDFFAGLCGRENLLGLGLNWEENSLEYVMGVREGCPLPEPAQVAGAYPDARLREVLLPEEGWLEYTGRTEALGALYEAIYRDGPLEYEIEAFGEDGSCRLRVRR